MRWLVLTQRSLLRRDDNFGGDSFRMEDWFLTQGSLLCRDDNFGWVLWIEVVGTYAEVPASSG